MVAQPDRGRSHRAGIHRGLYGIVSMTETILETIPVHAYYKVCDGVIKFRFVSCDDPHKIFDYIDQYGVVKDLQIGARYKINDEICIKVKSVTRL
jgi:hypothetical protein